MPFLRQPEPTNAKANRGLFDWFSLLGVKFGFSREINEFCLPLDVNL